MRGIDLEFHAAAAAEGAKDGGTEDANNASVEAAAKVAKECRYRHPIHSFQILTSVRQSLGKRGHT